MQKGLLRALLPLACATALAGYTADEARAQTAAESGVVGALQFDIPSGNLADALTEFGLQSGLQISYPQDAAATLRTEALDGRYVPAEALRRLLRGTGLEHEFLNPSTVVVRQAPKAKPARVEPVGETSADEPVTLPELLVRGSRSLNADIKRGIDDPQPYVVFDRADIERSGAININDFLLKRVSASTTTAPRSQAGEVLGDRSGIDLRGLGEGQTLILIDGRRVSNMSSGPSTGQPNLNGIPLAAVERIEVLPTTASAIYGGSATGGVINVILRRNFQGGEVSVSHDNSFDTDSSVNRVDLTYGFGLNEGRTSVMLTGSYSESNALLGRDRDFYQRGIRHIVRNSPDYLINAFRPGALPNIRSALGTDLVLDDGTQLNSAMTFVPAGYGGAATDGGAALIGNAGQLNTDLSPDASWFGGAGSIIGVMPRTKAFAASIRHSFSDRLDGFLDLSTSDVDSWAASGTYAYASLPADDARNPFQQDIHVIASTGQLNTRNTMFNETDRASAGLIARLGGNWAGSLDFTWSRASIGYTRRPGVVDTARLLADGFDPLDTTTPLDLLPYMASDISTYGLPLTSYTYNPTLRLSGPLWSLPAGPISASFLVEQQTMKYGQGAQWYLPNSGLASEYMVIFPPRSQEVRSAYAEFTVPLFGKANARRGLHALDLQLAGRRDDYESVSGNYAMWYPNSGAPRPDFEMVENSLAESTYLVGLKYQPFPGLTFRASRGTGFVPPEITQLGAPTTYTDFSLPSLIDPRRDFTGSPVPMTYVSGSNPDLGPEHSKTTSFGVIVQPESLPHFRASLDYTRLEKRDNVTSISPAVLLEYEELFPDRIRRGENLPGDPAGWAGPIVYIDTSYVNAAASKYETLDMQLKYGLDLENGGYLEFWGNGTWTLTAETRTLPGMPVTNLRGTSARDGGSIPLNFRGFYGVNYEQADWALGWAVRHYSSYLVANPELSSSAPMIEAQGNGGRVPRQLYHDLSARWRSSSLAGEGGGAVRSFLSNLEISGGIRNVFDKKPPVDLSSNFFFYSYLGDIRMRTYYLQLKYAF